MRKVALSGMVILAGLLLPTFAAGAQHPRALPHKAAPFGSHSKAACPPQSGRANCFALIETDASGAALTSALPSGYGPADFQTAYNLTALSANAGTGETVAIVDAYDDPNAESDLATYRSTYGLSACTTADGCFKKVNQTGGSTPPPVDSTGGWEVEESLDLDMVSAIAPNAHILLVEASSNANTDLYPAVDEAASLGANVISNSYGEPESSGSAGDNAYYDHPGIAVVVSSGDDGWDDCNLSCEPGPNYPASSPDVEAVGGTSLTSTSPRAESAWSGAGSGCSSVFSKPSWQTDPDCANRTVADVSADADPGTGAAVYDSYPYEGTTLDWVVVGGTSESAPINGGYDALLGSTTGTPGWEYGRNIWNDITTGSNGTCGTYICNAGSGYDGPTGLGTPNGTLAVPPTPTPAITSEPSNPTTSTSASFSFTDTDSTATFKCSLDGATYAVCTSPQSYTGLSAGSHTFGVEAVDTGGTSAPTTYTWTINPVVTPPATPTITSEPSNPTTSTSATFTFTDSTAGATFLCSLDGAAYAACTSPQSYTGLGVGSHTFEVEATDTGNTSSPATYTWTINPVPVTPPAPAITSEPTNPTTSTSASISFTDTDSTATFQCSLDGSAYVACTSPKSYTGLSTGSHTFKVEAVDTGGTSSPASYTWTINPVVSPPSTPTITSEPSNPTTSTSATFKFTDSVAAVTFECSLDGSAYSTCASPKSYTGLSYGSHTFKVEAVNSGGTSSPASYIWTITAPKCVVPWLFGDTLSRAETALADGHCDVGHVTNVGSRRTKHVFLQIPLPGQTEPNGYPVNIWLF
jgi:hypothetical protein